MDEKERKENSKDPSEANLVPNLAWTNIFPILSFLFHSRLLLPEHFLNDNRVHRI